MKRLADEASTTRLRYSFFPLARGGTGFRLRGGWVTRGSDPAVGSG